jgi:hypothetical protein
VIIRAAKASRPDAEFGFFVHDANAVNRQPPYFSSGALIMHELTSEPTAARKQEHQPCGPRPLNIIFPTAGGDAPVSTSSGFSVIQAQGTSLPDSNGNFPVVFAKTFSGIHTASEHPDPTMETNPSPVRFPMTGAPSNNSWSFNQSLGNAIPGTLTPDNNPGTGRSNSTLFVWYQYPVGSSSETTIDIGTFHALGCALYDTFTLTNGNGNSSSAQDHFMDKGPGWSPSTQDNGTAAGTWTINTSNQISQTASTTGWTKIVAEGNQSDGTASVTIVPAAGGCGLVFRNNANGFWRADLGTNSTLFLVKIQIVNGTVVPTVLQTNCTYAANAKLTVVCSGSMITATYNGATITSPSDSFNSTATQWGLTAFSNTNNPMTNFIVF